MDRWLLFGSVDTVKLWARWHRATSWMCAAVMLGPAVSWVAPAAATQARLAAPDGEAGDSYGQSVSVSGDTSMVGDGRSVWVFIDDGDGWSRQTRLTAGDGAPRDGFGHSVSVSGNTAVVGAPWHRHDDTTTGAAYVFTREGATWRQQAELVASDAADHSSFGVSVAAQGDTAIIGAAGDDHQGDSSGSAYVFTRTGDAWSERAKLTSDNAAPHARFGISVSLSGDVLVVGAPGDHAAGRFSGAAYVFASNGDVWMQQAILLADDASGSDRFGESVAVSGDTAVVGAPNDRDDTPSRSSGSSYVFQFDGATWGQQAKLIGSDTSWYDNLGSSVAVMGDTALIGAAYVFEDDERWGVAESWVHVFTRSGSRWAEQAKLVMPDTPAFGISVSSSGDKVAIGSRTLVRPPEADDYGPDAGTAFVFDLDADDDGLTDHVAPVYSSVLPIHRSGRVGSQLITFATMLNTRPSDAENCTIAVRDAVDADFLFRTTDPETNTPVGTMNQPVGIPAGQAQSFMIGLTPLTPLDTTELEFDYLCDGVGAAPTIAAVNGLTISATNDAVPDVVAIAETASGDGIVSLADGSLTGAFVVAAANLGSDAQIRARADAAGVSLPVELSICQTNGNAECINPVVPGTDARALLSSGEVQTFTVFVEASERVPFAPARNRIRVQFVDDADGVRGSTSVALR